MHSYATTEQALEKGSQILKKSGIPHYILDSEIILSRVLDISREDLLTHPQRPLTRSERDGFLNYISKRKQGTPLAYIIGYKHFRNLKLSVDENVLVPRPETELIIDGLIEYKDKNPFPGQEAVFLDIGTGSGCLVVATACELGRDIHKYIATDISKQALKVAYKNAKKYNVEQCIKFLYGDLMEPIFYGIKDFHCCKKIIITANLPYLTDDQYKNSPSIWKEPISALLGGDHGLDLYTDLVHQVKLFRARVGASIVLFLEIDPFQKKEIGKIIANEFPEHSLSFKKDLSGKTRVAIVEII
jgi:release factor glutamine methyltransferase